MVDREAQYQRQFEKRRLAREAAALAAAGKPNRERRGRPQGPQKRRCSKSTGGLPAKRAQCQKTPWMIRRRFRGKQTPMGVTVFARAAQATATHAAAIADRAKALADQAHAAETEALVAAAEAEARAQAAETACQQANELAERRASQWAAAEARKTSQTDKDRWSSFAALRSR